MQDILKEYGPAIITAAAVIALVVLVQALIGTNESPGLAWNAFTDLMDYFLEQVMPGAAGDTGAIFDELVTALV